MSNRRNPFEHLQLCFLALDLGVTVASFGLPLCYRVAALISNLRRCTAKMRKTFPELMQYLFLPNTLLLGYRNVRQDFISRPIPNCKMLHKIDAARFLAIRFRRRCRKSEWHLRYCVISNHELFLYKDQDGRSEDIETGRISLLRVLKFTVSANMTRYKTISPHAKKGPPVAPTAKPKSTEPICVVRIVDEHQRKYKLGIADPKDALYWTSSLYSAFFEAFNASPNPYRRYVPRKPKVHYRSYAMRTFVVRPKVVMEREIEDEFPRKLVNERHYAASSNVAVDDNVLPSMSKSPVFRDPKSFKLPSAKVKSKIAPKKSERQVSCCQVKCYVWETTLTDTSA